MDIDEALFIHLTTDAAVNALIGTQMYPLVADDEAQPPYIVYQRISTPAEHTHQGPSGMAHPRFQFACVANSYDGARILAKAVRTALDGYKGTMGGGVTVHHVKLDNEIEDYEFDTQYRRVIQDAIIWHQE